MIYECEVCGSKRATRKARIERAILNVCDECVTFGEEIPTIEVKPISKVKFEELKKALVKDFNEIVKKERIKRKLTQKDLAKKIGEKISIIKRIENGWEPPEKIIRKMENFFSVKLLEEVTEEKTERKASKKELTIGDIVEIS